MAGATWNCSRLSASSVYTIQPCTMSLHAKPHMQGGCVFSCNLPPALLAEWPGSFMCYHGNTGVEQIPKYQPWRRKFSCHSSRDLNPRPFNHESGTLTTELSPPPIVTVLLYLERVGVWGKGRGRDRGYFSIKTVSMLRSCFAWCLRF